MTNCIFKFSIPLLVILFASCNNNREVEIILPKGEKITNDNFTGTAYLHQVIVADSLNDTRVGNVTFEAGARTKWYLHPSGQILLVTGA